MGGTTQAVTIEVATPRGPSRVDLDLPRAGRGPGRTSGVTGLLVLGHGAGGGVDARDLLAVRDAATAHGLAVARVTQPYRLAGRRAPAPARHLDEAWTATVTALRGRPGLRGVPVVAGGRSSGARVACRTAVDLGAVGVLALAFPLHPPGRPERSRVDELTGAGVPVLVVQGDRDAFGGPDEIPAGVRVRVVAGGDHGFARAADLDAAAAEAARWVRDRVAGAATAVGG